MNDDLKKVETRGGKRAGAGKPKTVINEAKSRSIRLTDEQYRKFKLVGGAQWLRDILG